ncbi:MAG: aminopeptidase P family N-terminal domain-containing protein, partial [Rhodobacteraceae bacterium]|nr:aminopeptidase P family N-terminal domain-containing protein [Paracoccaceae bacterium]
MRHFSDQEFAERRAGLMQELERRGLDGLLCFAQESMYWLTGYDTFGFCFFQCLVVSKQHLVLITRSADRLQANLTSNVKDVVIWVDDEMADPAADLAELLHQRGFSGKNLGIELDTHG